VELSIIAARQILALPIVKTERPIVYEPTSIADVTKPAMRERITRTNILGNIFFIISFSKQRAHFETIANNTVVVISKPKHNESGA